MLRPQHESSAFAPTAQVWNTDVERLEAAGAPGTRVGVSSSAPSMPSGKPSSLPLATFCPQHQTDESRLMPHVYCWPGTGRSQLTSVPTRSGARTATRTMAGSGAP